MAHVVKTLFGKPKCSVHGTVVTPTGYSYPYAEWRCATCLREEKQRRAYEQEKWEQEQCIKNLENKINDLPSEK